MTPSQKLGYIIKQQRKSKRMSQTELAQKACTTQSAIARIEAGTALNEIADALHMRIHIDFIRRYNRRHTVRR
jgi:transcriptional regulator with XRE-family HTH domain